VSGPPWDRRWAQSQPRMGGLHRLIDHRQQLAVQGIQVDLVTEADREALHGAAASERRRLKRRSTLRWIRRRSGWKAAAAARVAAATARLPDPATRRPAAGTISRYGTTSRAVTVA
jgi:hypothetical protein